MAKALAALGFEAVEDRVLFSADLGTSPMFNDIDRDSAQVIQDQSLAQNVQEAESSHTNWVAIDSYMVQISRQSPQNSVDVHRPLLIVAEDIEGEALYTQTVGAAYAVSVGAAMNQSIS